MSLLASIAGGVIGFLRPDMSETVQFLAWFIPACSLLVFMVIGWHCGSYDLYRELEESKDAIIERVSRELADATDVASVGDVREFLFGIANKGQAIMDSARIENLSKHGQPAFKPIPWEVGSEWYQEMCDGVRRSVRSHVASEILKLPFPTQDCKPESARGFVSSYSDHLRKLATKLTVDDVIPSFRLPSERS